MKILLVEDEPHVSSFISKGLEEEGFHVEAAFDGFIGKKLAFRNDYDVIILDVILPNINGLELCGMIRDEKIDTPILMLTALGSTDDVVAGLGKGADDYLKKPFKFRELLARIHALARRHQHQVTAPVLKIADLEINEATKEVTRNGKSIKLTPREFFLLEYFVRNNGMVRSRTEIAESVWGNYTDSNSNIVDVYVNYLRNKIDKDFSPKLIHTVTGMGYIFKPGDE